MPAKYAVLAEVLLDHIIENDIVSDKALDTLFESVLEVHKIQFPNKAKGRQVLADLKQSLS